MAELTVVPILLTQQPVDRTNDVGSTAAFSLTASGTAPLSYQWYHGEQPLPGQTKSSCALTNVQFADVGEYWVMISNPYGTTNSARARVEVVPFFIMAQPADQAVTEGANVSFSVAVTGTGPFQYQWYFSGSPLAGKTYNP